MTVVAYTDASHCDRNRIAACGFVVLINGAMIKHQIILFGNMKSATFAECAAVLHSLYYCFLMPGVTRIVVHTDCMAIVKHGIVTHRRKPRFIHELVETLEIIRDYGVQVQICFCKGHAENKTHNFIDQSSRKQLRNYIKQNQNEKEQLFDLRSYAERHPVTYYRSNNRL